MVWAVIWGCEQVPEGAVCRSLIYEVVDGKARMYITQKELNEKLLNEHLYPVGQALDSGILYRIERSIESHPMIRTAECYVTPRNQMFIRVTQRVPLLRVITPVDTYFIDEDRRVMPVREAVKDKVLVAKGVIGVQIATKQLADFAIWLKDNKYWQSRVAYVMVQNPHKVYLYLLGEQNPRVLMGDMIDYDKKLDKLRIFLEHGSQAFADKKYTELDLRFEGQVIGR